jgi:hypothetical protein
MKKRLRKCYHGTNKSAAEIILKTGFNPRTYFARHLEDALDFGGRYVFEVMFETEKIPNDWQFMIKRKRHPKYIVRLNYYPKIKTIQENKKLGDKIFKSNLIK